ncbi:MAG: hypothetical protein C4530_22450 [Desulfobacteraceae bacterium]|nr:MAG: hypothetical protein C4530_22450 [Desulfobacteraceae bacterium]
MAQQPHIATSGPNITEVPHNLSHERQSPGEAIVSYNGSDVSLKRLLGAYYTPENLAEILVNWTLSDINGTVLDPSFGGCSFLTAATRVLAKKGIKEPSRLVFGVDVDPSCIEHVQNRHELRKENCIIRDFLELSPRELPGAPFKAIVGNPPYVRHHWLKGSRRDAARNAVETSGVPLPATASTWAYFLVHALSFIEKGGRLAMLVPEAILQADYAIPVRNALTERFGHVFLIHIRDRLFEGTVEPVVVVAASDYGKKGKIQIEAIERAEDLEDLLKKSNKRWATSHVTNANGRAISTETIDLLDKLKKHEMVHGMGDIAAVRIGLVTGANRHFIRSTKDLKTLGIPCNARLPVVAKTRWLSGLRFTREDHQDLEKAGSSVFLVRPMQRFDSHPGVRRWIEEGIAAGVENRFKCSQRADWFRLKTPPVPDAFATCARLGSPLLVINSARYHCSNTLHSVQWKKDLEISPEVIVLGFLTSFVRAWAELHGRRYGGGVLKLEPGTLSMAPIPIAPSAGLMFEEVDRMLRDGFEEEARRRADKVVLGEGLRLETKDIRALQHACSMLAAQRQPGADRGRNA